jgi:hypothetical protein
MRVLHLTLKKKWFDMVGPDKPEEYRDLTMFWAKRFCDGFPGTFGIDMNCQSFKEWDQVLFANGGHFGNVPKKLFEFKGIEIREGNPQWGAEPGKKYFVIKLGDRMF